MVEMSSDEGYDRRHAAACAPGLKVDGDGHTRAELALAVFLADPKLLIWQGALVKTMIGIPGTTLRCAKSIAGSRGVSLKQLFTEALEDKLKRAGAPAAEPGWMKPAGTFGKSASVRAETRRIQQRIEAEFEMVEPEDAS